MPPCDRFQAHFLPSAPWHLHIPPSTSPRRPVRMVLSSFSEVFFLGASQQDAIALRGCGCMSARSSDLRCISPRRWRSRPSHVLGEQVWIRVQGDGMIAQGVGVAVARIWTLSALDDRCSCSCSRSACGMGKRR